ncbi:MAG: hypothetical protein LC775_04630, partial [Acidobacteria bacterium]|nr:hypothetical protein [Acidobacteriota bacterium]
VERSPLSLRKFAGWVREFEWDAPPELLGLGDQRPQDIDWNYWTTLDLWRIDVACKLVCGVNPNEPTRRDDIENPDTLTRPAWVNLFHKAQAAVMSGKLRVQAGCVYPAELVVWAQGKGIQIPGGLGRLNLTTDQPSVEAGSSPRRAHNEERDTAIFRTMTELKWSEVSITFIEPEAVRIKAREKAKPLPTRRWASRITKAGWPNRTRFGTPYGRSPSSPVPAKP